LPIGAVGTSSGRTITEGELALLSSLLWTVGPVHTDDIVAGKGPFGARILPGPAVMGVLEGLYGRSDFHRRLVRDHQVRVIAVVGATVSYRGVVRAGDTLRVRAEVQGARPSSTARGRGTLELRLTGINQLDEEVAHIDRTVLFERSSSSGRQ
jgi:acyl dehydratase